MVTYLQLFGIGFSFGIIGPCFLTCAPVLITYIVGSKRDWPDILRDILTFLTGRLSAYVLLGALAGFSGVILRNFTSSVVSSFFQPLAGAVTILFAIIILINRNKEECFCADKRNKFFNYGGIFVFGFLIGVSPCAPLLALLFDIGLMSKSVLDGALYAFSFGLGTFASGLLTVGIMAGLLARIPAVIIKSSTANIVFRVLCSVLLLLLGLSLLIQFKKPV